MLCDTAAPPRDAAGAKANPGSNGVQTPCDGAAWLTQTQDRPARLRSERTARSLRVPDAIPGGTRSLPVQRRLGPVESRDRPTLLSPNQRCILRSVRAPLPKGSSPLLTIFLDGITGKAVPALVQTSNPPLPFENLKLLLGWGRLEPSPVESLRMSGLRPKRFY